MSLHQLFSILRARRAAAGLILLVTLVLAACSAPMELPNVVTFA